VSNSCEGRSNSIWAKGPLANGCRVSRSAPPVGMLTYHGPSRSEGCCHVGWPHSGILPRGAIQSVSQSMPKYLAPQKPESGVEFFLQRKRPTDERNDIAASNCDAHVLCRQMSPVSRTSEFGDRSPFRGKRRTIATFHTRRPVVTHMAELGMLI
jgi:hypothetical protein